MTHGAFPNTRLRRTRQADWIRRMVRETRIDPAQLIQPLFVAEGDLLGPVKSMPGQSRLSLAELKRDIWRTRSRRGRRMNRSRAMCFRRRFRCPDCGRF